MSLWWLQPGWTETCCSQCGAKIWPAGDPDWLILIGEILTERGIPQESGVES